MLGKEEEGGWEVRSLQAHVRVARAMVEGTLCAEGGGKVSEVKVSSVRRRV